MSPVPQPGDPPRSVALLGLGLMGGSLGLALRARGYAGRRAAYARRAEVRAEALRRGVADAVFERPEDAVRGADLVVLCVPVLDIPALAAAAAPALAPGAAVTDVGSTKAWIAAAMRAALGPAARRFVGSHPIAGSERQGLDAAAADLYAGATVVLAPGPDADPATAARVAALWRFVGARLVTLSPDDHDRRLARTSHLPHLAAAALAAAAGRGDGADRIGPFCGTGFRDTTRVADGSPAVWHDIVRTNREPLLEELEAFGRQWAALTDALRREDYEAVRGMLADGRDARRRLLAAAPAAPNPKGDEA